MSEIRTEEESAEQEAAQAPAGPEADASPSIAGDVASPAPDAELTEVPEVSDEETPAAAESDDDLDDEFDESFVPPVERPGDWYVVHTYAGYENKVKANLMSRISSMNVEDKIFEVVIPMEDVMEIKQGKKQVVQKKVFPGYLLVRMYLEDDSWYVVRNTPGVTGFVQSGAKPVSYTHLTLPTNREV